MQTWICSCLPNSTVNMQNKNETTIIGQTSALFCNKRNFIPKLVHIPPSRNSLKSWREALSLLYSISIAITLIAVAWICVTEAYFVASCHFICDELEADWPLSLTATWGLTHCSKYCSWGWSSSWDTCQEWDRYSGTAVCLCNPRCRLCHCFGEEVSLFSAGLCAVVRMSVTGADEGVTCAK